MRLRPRSLLPVAAVALAATVAVPVAPAVQAAPAPAAQQPVARSVTLITGDVVRLSGSADRPDVAMIARDPRGVAGSFRTLRGGGRTSVVPSVALPYVGKQLDPALFDVTALAAAPAGRLPVRIAWAAGATRHAIPGVTVTSSSAGADSGYLTPASSRAFGQALADQVRADRGPSATGVLAGVASLRYAGATAPAATPRFPMFTLRIPVLDEAGRPATYAGLSIVNTDDARKYAAFPYADDGEVRISVPAGNYSLLAEFASFDPATGTFVERFVNVSDFAVTGPTTLRPVDARTATTEVALTGTPRPATLDDLSVSWVRLDESEGGLGSSYLFDGSTKVYVAPGRPVTHGQLSWSDRFHASAADGSYTYDLVYGADGAIPAVQRYRATAAQLATLTVKYHSDVPQELHPARFSPRPLDQGGFVSSFPVQAPTTRTEYVGGSQDADFAQIITGFTYFDDEVFIVGDYWSEGYRPHPAGERTTVEWKRAPLHASLDVDTGSNPYGFYCPACRAGDVLSVYVTPLEDSERGHFGGLDAYGDTPVGRIDASTRLRIWRAGTLLADVPDFFGTDLTVPAGDARFRVLFTETRQAPWIRYGTRITTDWGFRSGTPAAQTAPADWICGAEGVPCAVLPMLTAQYQAPVDLANTVAPGPGTVRVSLRPTQGAPPVSVDQASVAWSGDDGATWATAATRPLGDSTFAATIPNPAGGTVSLRVSGTDRAGNTITQTVIRAYGVRA